MFKKILCALDGSDHAHKALDLAIDLATRYDADLVLVHALLSGANTADLQRFAEVENLASHVDPELQRLRSIKGRLELSPGRAQEDPTMSSRALVEIGRHIIKDAKSDAELKGVRNVTTLLVGGDPADAILESIDSQDADCVVMGCRGLSQLKAAFLGSVSHKVSNRAPCTCITVR